MKTVSPLILVTGASRGLGRGIAVELSAAGFSVAIHFVSNRIAAEETMRQCEERRLHTNQSFRLFPADLSRREERIRLVEEVVREMGIPDGLVNNAGIAPRVRADIVKAEEEIFDEVIAMNLKGPYFLTQHIVRHWLGEKAVSHLPSGFKIVFVTSVSAGTASINRGEYCISKAGLSMASQLWATRLAAENIQVYEVRPGIMDTDMTSRVRDSYSVKIADGLVPQRRWGTPRDTGLAVCALMKGEFPFSTGSIIDVDGGLHLRRL